ncbi:MAG: TIGR02594 family protein [Flavobacteriaceae bacterium]|nr:TIGR02594 family protein [Flavobacteriaceae bacterium]
MYLDSSKYTENFQDKSLQINIKQGQEKGIVKKDEALTVQQNDKDVVAIEATTSDMCHTDYLNKDDFKDLAIAKIKLAPKDKDKLKLWNDSLKDLTDKKTSLFLLISVTCQDGTPVVYNGENPAINGELDKRSTPNYWLDVDGKWFEVKKNQRAPWMEIAKKEIGEEEIYGITENNPRVLEYHKTAGYNKSLMGREITDDWIGNIKDAWCGSFIYWCFYKSGIKKSNLNKTGYNAFSWKKWGKTISKPAYGALAILSYSHVAFVVGKKGDDLVLLEGNQTGGDKDTYGKVCYNITKKSKIIGYRFPKNYEIITKDYELKEINTDAETDSSSTTR